MKVSMKRKLVLRNTIESAYLYAWGPQGNADLRDLFKENMVYLQKFAGYFSYKGSGLFKWKDY